MSLLQELGYRNLRIYPGGMADWIEHAGEVEGASSTTRVQARPTRPASIRTLLPGRMLLAVIDALAARSVGQVLLSWLGMVVGFGIVYWIACLTNDRALMQGGAPVPPTWAGLAAALYFSFTTATSVGYGDVVPVGAVRILAIVEAMAGLLVFGFVISKFLSRRQEQLIEEIHRIAYEDRLGRVQTNLHLVLSELQAISASCADRAVAPPRIVARTESAAMVFAGELRTIHDLLYRPQQVPEEQVLEVILASLAAAFQELSELIRCIPDGVSRSQTLQRNLRSIARVASEICGDCVPRAYATALTEWMDRIQKLARTLGETHERETR